MYTVLCEIWVNRNILAFGNRFLSFPWFTHSLNSILIDLFICCLTHLYAKGHPRVKRREHLERFQPQI